jgi:hypothetical protein
MYVKHFSIQAAPIIYSAKSTPALVSAEKQNIQMQLPAPAFYSPNVSPEHSKRLPYPPPLTQLTASPLFLLFIDLPATNFTIISLSMS